MVSDKFNNQMFNKKYEFKILIKKKTSLNKKGI